MKLPPVDDFRKPLVEPLGHLAMQAAYLDNALYSFIAMMMPFGPDTSIEQVAHKLRNWDADFFVAAIDGAIADPDLANDLHDYVRRITEKRENRHRMIHDAMEVGIQYDPRSGFQTFLQREGYVRSDKHHSILNLTVIEPGMVADLAIDFYDLRGEIDEFLGRWKDLGGATKPSVFD